MTSTHPLKAYRDRHDLSQGDLADMLGVSRVAVTRWESGARQPDRDLLAKIAEKTGIHPADLRPDLAEIFKAAE